MYIYNQMHVGKTFCKTLGLPNILYATELIIFSEQEISKLQKQIYMQMPIYTPNEFLSG